MRLLPDIPGNRLAASELLRRGGLVVFPTDTLYGLAACVYDAAAVARVFAVKGRTVGVGLPVLVDGIERLREVAAVSPVALEMAERFWPGPLTLVLPRSQRLPAAVRGGVDTVAVRHPDHPAPLALVMACGAPITGTSANTSGGPEPVTAQEAVRQLGDTVDLVLDGGACPRGVASTVVDVTRTPVRVLRTGALTVEAIRRVCDVEEEVAAGL